MFLLLHGDLLDDPNAEGEAEGRVKAGYEWRITPLSCEFPFEILETR